MTPKEFQQETNVSRETLDRLQTYGGLLETWQTRMNLVGPKTLPDMWHRHFFDSAQLFDLLPEGTRTLVDLGSGAGFPGLVLSLMGVPETHLIESDQRKARFLREVVRETDAAVEVHACRAESLTDLKADVITARALAPMKKLFPLVARFARKDSVVLLPKGQHVDDELTEYAIPANIQLDRTTSRTNPDGSILRLTGWV
ncbi:MAG: 16S rRNA (guanine(527)-N(7))-methyltransferase RsmG [Pseudomonadota bacterium]